MSHLILFDVLVQFVAFFLPTAQQYMMSNKQLGRNFLPNNNHPPASLQIPKPFPSSSNDQSPSAILGILSCISAKKYSEAFSESVRIKVPVLQDLTRVAYEHSLLRYLLHTRDKIVQVNPEQNLLTEGGMMNLRTAGLYREQAAQARTNYAAIVENIKKLATPSSYFQCTLPNRQDLIEVKSALQQLFQEMKNRQRQSHSQPQTIASSQATEREQGNVMECKESLLEIISLVMPTQTLRTSVNREKTLKELSVMAKDHIKEAFLGFQQEMELLQSRAHFCERSLESERVTKLERERQVQELQQELISSQRYIEDLEGLKAATEMENLGLHSKIRSKEGADEKEHYQGQIERLMLENEELRGQIVKIENQMQSLREQLEETQSEMEGLHNQLNAKLQRVSADAEQQKQHLSMQLEEQRCKTLQLQRSLSQKQSQLFKLYEQLTSHSHQLTDLMQKHSTVKLQKEQLENQLNRLEGTHLKCEDYPYEISKLSEELECLQFQHAHTQQSLKQEEERRTASDNLNDHLQKLLEEGEQERINLQEQIETLTSEGQHYCQASRDLEERLRELQEEVEYIMAEKNHYERLHLGVQREEKSVETVVTIEDLKIIEESLASFAERENELEELYSQNQLLKNQLHQSQWTREHA